MSLGPKLPLLLLLAVAACGDTAKRPLGASCGDDAECASGECIAQVCLDPSGDEDGDGLVNRLEAALGSSPLERDSDADGVDDAAEVGVDLANPSDQDGDGRIDAIESRTADADRDCIVDQLDAEDAVAESDPSTVARFTCLTTGACGAAGAVVSATCSDGVPSCDYSRVPLWSDDDATCDGIDNDCDGTTDERFASGGEVAFDGGPYPADQGKVLGDPCGTGACEGGVVMCATDGRSLVCSTAGRAGPLACGADMDCDGVGDPLEIGNPLSTPLAGCAEHYPDADGDGFGAGAGRCLCAPYGDYVVTVRDDCAETDPDRHPRAPAICGVDADCDGDARDIGEACDDQDDDPDDGCHACRAVARRIAPQPDFYAITGLAGGGFVVAIGGETSTSVAGAITTRRPRALVFDARGAAIATIGGGDLPVDAPYHAGAVSLAALAGGGFALGTWTEPAVDGWRFRVQGFDAQGAPLGEPVEAWRAAEPFAGIVLGEVGGNVAVVIPVDGVQLRLVTPDGQLLRAAGSARVTDAYDVGAIGLGDRVAVSWSRYDADTFQRHVELEQFDTALQPLGEVIAIATGPDPVFDAHLARHDDGAAVFFLSGRDADGTRPIGYVLIDADGGAMGPIYVEQDDADGCPYSLVGGFDAGGYAWAALADGECRSPLRAWHAGATTQRLSPFDGALHPDAVVYDVVGAAAGGGFVLLFEVDDGATSGLFLMRYGPAAAPVYLPDGATTTF